MSALSPLGQPDKLPSYGVFQEFGRHRPILLNTGGIHAIPKQIDSFTFPVVVRSVRRFHKRPEPFLFKTECGLRGIEYLAGQSFVTDQKVGL